MRISDWSSDVCSSDLSFGTAVFITIFAAFVFFAPDFFGEAENYTEANPLKTPAHIVPEWYSLPSYPSLRSIDFDTWFIPPTPGGVIAMFASILVLFVLPWIDRSPVPIGRAHAGTPVTT